MAKRNFRNLALTTTAKGIALPSCVMSDKAARVADDLLATLRKLCAQDRLTAYPAGHTVEIGAVDPRQSDITFHLAAVSKPADAPSLPGYERPWLVYLPLTHSQSMPNGE
jgi:hypothetical protein